jgi:hypothetical protein
MLIVLGIRLVQSEDWLTPVGLAIRHIAQRVRVEQRPISRERHTRIPKRPAENAITAAVVAQQVEPASFDRGV